MPHRSSPATRIRNLADHFGYSVVSLAARLYLGVIFFASGWVKFQALLHGDWSSAVVMFEEATPVPFLPAPLAAALTTTGELTLSLMLIFGIYTRIAAAGLLVMTLVIQIVLPTEEHNLWGFIFALLACKGGGRLALDALWAMRAHVKNHAHEGPPRPSRGDLTSRASSV